MIRHCRWRLAPGPVRRQELQKGGDGAAGDAPAPGGTIDPIGQLRGAVGGQLLIVPTSRSSCVMARRVISGEAISVAMWASKAPRSSGSSTVNAAMRTDSGSRRCSKTASRSSFSSVGGLWPAWCSSPFAASNHQNHSRALAVKVLISSPVASRPCPERQEPSSRRQTVSSARLHP